jgi:hypothetical protein
MSELSALLHFLRDGLLLAIGALDRDDELAAAEQLEETLNEGRRRLEELRAA